MKSFLLKIAFVLCSLFAAPLAWSADGPDLFIKCEVGESTIYERQSATLTVSLYSSVPDIAYANPSSKIHLKKGECATWSQVRPVGNAYETKIDGRRYFCFPLELFVFSIDEKGSYEFVGESYEVGVSVPIVVNDPFWGPVRSAEVKNYTVPVKRASFKVKSLPNPPMGSRFSGAVGSFSIETVVPAGDVIVNEEATAVVVLRGEGLIPELTMPEYRTAFTDGVKLKSVSEARSSSFVDGKLVSELHLDCTFIPTRRDDVKIGSVSFSYFDPSSGKYVTSTSSPVDVKVKSGVSKRESLDI